MHNATTAPDTDFAYDINLFIIFLSFGFSLFFIRSRHTAGGRYPVLRVSRKTCVIFHYASWLCQLDSGLDPTHEILQFRGARCRNDDKRGIHYASCRLWRQLDPGLDPTHEILQFRGARCRDDGVVCRNDDPVAGTDIGAGGSTQCLYAYHNVFSSFFMG